MGTNFRNKMASQHSFAMIPRTDIPRSKYLLQQNRKTTFNAGDLVPIYCEEILPGDHFDGSSMIYARMATPITPVLDNAELETFYFFVPNRIVWEHWDEFITGGNYTIPDIDDYAADPIATAVGSLYDQFGLPVTGQLGGGATMFVNALPFRAYNKIFNEWFRDQNLVTALDENIDDGPDAPGDYALQQRMKKHDYFTSALPWPQKGTAVSLPLGTTAPVITNGQPPVFNNNNPANDDPLVAAAGGAGAVGWGASSAFPGGILEFGAQTGLVTNLAGATAATINAIRTAFQVQRLLERDARGGTRLTETIQSHFGVRPPDYRLDRPEYIGGGRSMVTTAPIAQTSETGTTALGDLAGFTTIHGGAHRFKYAATEHGYILGLANVRADLTYQQGVRKHWDRETRYDYYWPVFAHLGEQTVTRREIWAVGIAGSDDTVFGYQERYAEYRYTPNEICGYFRSTAAGSIDIWHYSEEFASAPSLNAAFIKDPSKTTIGRTMAVGEDSYGTQILLDVLHKVYATRPMPTYGVPGLIDHF